MGDAVGGGVVEILIGDTVTFSAVLVRRLHQPGTVMDPPERFAVGTVVGVDGRFARVKWHQGVQFVGRTTTVAAGNLWAEGKGVRDE